MSNVPLTGIKPGKTVQEYNFLIYQISDPFLTNKSGLFLTVYRYKWYNAGNPSRTILNGEKNRANNDNHNETGRVKKT